MALDGQLGQPALYLADQLGQVEVTLWRAVLDHLVDLAVPLGVEGGQGQVLELIPNLLHAQPVGQRCVDVQGLLGHPLLLVFGQGGQGPHVVEAVVQLDDQHPKVLGQGDEHLAHAGRLVLLAGIEPEAVQLGHAVHDEPDVGPEVPFQVVQADRGVLDGVVEEGSGHRDVG